MDIQNFCKNYFFHNPFAFLFVLLSCHVLSHLYSFVFICLLLCCLVPRVLSLVSILSSLAPGGCMLLGLALAGALDHLLHGHILELGPLPEPFASSSLEGISS